MLIEGGGGEDRFFPTGNRRSGFSLTRGGEYTWTEFFRKAVSRNGPALFFFILRCLMDFEMDRMGTENDKVG